MEKETKENSAKVPAVVKKKTAARKPNINKSQLVINDMMLLRQPLVLTLLNYSSSVIGNRVMVTIVRKLQDVFDDVIKGHAQGKTDWRQLQIFDKMETIEDRIVGKDEVVFEIHMSELVNDSKRYQEAFNEVYKFSRIPVTYDITEYRDGVKRTATVSEQLFKTITVEEENMERVRDKKGEVVYRYKNRRPQVALVFSKAMADRIFSFRDRYGDFLDVPAIESSDKYFARIYIFLSAYKNLDPPVKEVEYDTFREMLGIGKMGSATAMYPVYKDFFRRVVEPSMKEMKRKAETGDIDIWFDMEKGTNDGKRAATPDWLRFTIHLTDLGVAIRDAKRNMGAEADLSERLVHDFSQSRTQAAALLRRAQGMDLTELGKKLDDLEQARKEGKIIISRSACSYYNKTITAFIDKYHADHKPSAPGMDEADAKGSTTDSPQPELRDNGPLWDSTPREWTLLRQECIRTFDAEVFDELFKYMDYEGMDGNMLVLHMPTRELVEKFEDSEHFDTFFQLLRKHFGDDVELHYSVS